MFAARESQTWHKLFWMCINLYVNIIVSAIDLWYLTKQHLRWISCLKIRWFSLVWRKYHFHLNARWAPQKIKHQLKNYFSLNFIHLIYDICWILSASANQCHCLHLHSQCLHLPFTHSSHTYPLHCHSTRYHESHPLHWIYGIKTLLSFLVRCIAMPLWYTVPK